MGLYERWTATDSTKITVHDFGAYFGEALRAALTPQQVVDEFNLDEIETQQLDEMLNFQASASPVKKAEYQLTQESVQVLCESGRYDKGTAYDRLGIVTDNPNQA